MPEFGDAKRVLLYPGVTDMRLGIFGLIRKITNPENGCCYVFCGKNRRTVKILCYEGTSVWLCQKRVFRGKFTWPETGKPTDIDVAMLRFLLTGIDRLNSIELDGKIPNYSMF